MFFSYIYDYLGIDLWIQTKIMFIIKINIYKEYIDNYEMFKG